MDVLYDILLCRTFIIFPCRVTVILMVLHPLRWMIVVSRVCAVEVDLPDVTPEPLFNLFHDIFISAVPNNIKNLLEHIAANVDRSKSLQGPCGTAVTAIAPVCALRWQKPGTVQLMFRLHFNRTRCIRCSIVSVYCCNIVCLTLL